MKWALGSITKNKVSGDDGIPAELFQILKDDALKVLHSVWQQIWKTQQWPQDWKRSVFITVPKKGNAKECSNYRTIVPISHGRIMLKTLQAKLQLYVNQDYPAVQAGFRKGKGTRLTTSVWSQEKQGNSRKTSISASLNTQKPLAMWITRNWKILHEMRILKHHACLLRNLYAD